MCINIFSYFKKSNYDIIRTIDCIDLSVNPFQYALLILEKNEPDLILRYSPNGTILFSKEWIWWHNRLHEEAFDFMNRFKPPQFRIENKPQIVYVCSIPEEHHIEFLNVIKKEYGM